MMEEGVKELVSNLELEAAVEIAQKVENMEKRALELGTREYEILNRGQQLNILQEQTITIQNQEIK
jgi:hypothetical protein